MSAPMAILVDPYGRTVTEVDMPDPGSGELAELLCCEDVGHTTLGDVGCMFIDDAGLFKEGQKFWSFRNNPAIIYAGRGLIYAVDEHGETVDKLVPAVMVEPHVVWRQVRVAGTKEFTEEFDHPSLGRMTRFVSQAQFEPLPDANDPR